MTSAYGSALALMSPHPVLTFARHCMDAYARGQHHSRMRVLTHIKMLDDCFGQFLVRVICDCGACREIEPEALARLVGWSMTLRELALRMRCSKCGKKAAEGGGGCEAQAAGSAHEPTLKRLRRGPRAGVLDDPLAKRTDCAHRD
jgi:hypothetical protein